MKVGVNLLAGAGSAPFELESTRVFPEASMRLTPGGERVPPSEQETQRPVVVAAGHGGSFPRTADVGGSAVDTASGRLAQERMTWV